MSMNLESMNFSELATLARQIEETKRKKYDECLNDWFSAIDIFKDLFIFEPSDFSHTICMSCMALTILKKRYGMAKS